MPMIASPLGSSLQGGRSDTQGEDVTLDCPKRPNKNKVRDKDVGMSLVGGWVLENTFLSRDRPFMVSWGHRAEHLASKP